MISYQFGINEEGKSVLIFENPHDILPVISAILERKVSLPTPAVSRVQLAPASAAADSAARARKRGRTARSVLELTEYQTEWERQRTEINNRVSLLRQLRYHTTEREVRARDPWILAYSLLEYKTQYRVSGPSRMSYGNHGVTKVNQLLKDGKGLEMIRVLDDYLATKSGVGKSRVQLTLRAAN